MSGELTNADGARASVITDFASGLLRGAQVVRVEKRVGDLAGYWYDARAFESADAGALLYTTESWFPAPDGTPGAILWGNTTLYPGRIGAEYHITRGHWHRKREMGELVVCVAGRGALILMSEDRETRIEILTPGSTHHVPGHTAHRTANTGAEPLVFLCAWSADCGHDYDDILHNGFSRVLVERDGAPRLVAR